MKLSVSYYVTIMTKEDISDVNNFSNPKKQEDVNSTMAFKSKTHKVCSSWKKAENVLMNMRVPSCQAPFITF